MKAELGRRGVMMDDSVSVIGGLVSVWYVGSIHVNEERAAGRIMVKQSTEEDHGKIPSPFRFPVQSMYVSLPIQSLRRSLASLPRAMDKCSKPAKEGDEANHSHGRLQAG